MTTPTELKKVAINILYRVFDVSATVGQLLSHFVHSTDVAHVCCCLRYSTPAHGSFLVSTTARRISSNVIGNRIGY